jgi:SAM-dependent methyltransferase
VLEVGCGTGTLATALVEREHAKVWAIDAEPAMVAEARARLPRGAQAKVAEAEALPFKDGWFDRAIMRLVVHHLDRPTAFAELRRVLAGDGRLVIATLEPASFAAHWAAPFFPSLPAIDAARFPDEDTLRTELRAAGFGAVETWRHDQTRTRTRDHVLAQLRGRHISTFELLPAAELEAGVALAERTLPETIETTQSWLVVVAAR